MKKLSHWIFATSFFTVAGLFYACTPEDDPEPQDQIDVQTIEDASFAELEYDDIIQIAEDVQDGNYDGRNGRIESCAVVSLDANTVVIDFGDGCEGLDGRIRKGKIIVTYKGQARTPGAETTATFENFFIEEYEIRGTVKNFGFVFNSQGNLQHSRSVNNGQVIFPDGSSIQFENNRTVEWTKGISTLFDLSDDEFEITGSGSGVNRQGVPYTDTITTPLIASPACWLQGILYPTTGVIRYNVGSLQILLDYGTGTCDKIATASLGNLTVTLNLP